MIIYLILVQKFSLLRLSFLIALRNNVWESVLHHSKITILTISDSAWIIFINNFLYDTYNECQTRNFMEYTFSIASN